MYKSYWRKKGQKAWHRGANFSDNTLTPKTKRMLRRKNKDKIFKFVKVKK